MDTTTSDKIISKIRMLTQIRLKKGYTSSPELESKFLPNAFIPIDQLESHAAKFSSIHVGKKPSDDWCTVGVIDRLKIQDKKFCVARISNMFGSYFHLFIFGKAYTKYEKELQVGYVIGIFKPKVARSSDVKADVAVSVDNKDQLLMIGESEDLIQCSHMILKNKQCQAMLDGRSGTLCDHHIAMACKSSKNTRMELASGDSALEVRWAKVSSSESGGSIYQTTQPEKKQDREYTYIFDGRGPITSEGKELRVKNPKTYANDLKKKQELADILKGRNDVGAQMLRKINGIEEEKKPSTNALSREAMLKLGYSRTEVLTKEELDKKRKVIDELLRMDGARSSKSKKPRYVEL